MKCPKCKYTSFDNLPSCKKCGYVFERNGDTESVFSSEYPFSEAGADDETIHQGEKPANLSETVASIKESLDEIEGDESIATENKPSDRVNRVKSDRLQRRESETRVDNSELFPTHGEINWDESISISSDDLNLDAFDVPDEKDELTFKDEGSEIVSDRMEKIKRDLEMVGEELKQIDEEPIINEPPGPSELTYDEDHPPDVRKGGFWIRLGAFVIDNIVLYILAFILSIVGIIALGLGSSGLEEFGEEDMYRLILPLYVFNTILTIAYYTYFHGSTGQTPGKMVCGLKVIRVNGEPLGYVKAFLRWLGYMVSGFLFCLGFLWAGWDKNKQAWHDKIVGTYVIRI